MAHPQRKQEGGRSDMIIDNYRKYNTHVAHVLCLPLTILFLLFSLWCEISYADDPLPTGREFLINKYHTIEKELEKSSSAVPFYLESSVSKNASRIDIYGTIEYPFDSVKNELQMPVNWCDILLLHTNVRACTYMMVANTWLLTVYNVDKSSDTIEDADQLKFKYYIIAQKPGFVDIALAAREGPFGTKDHQFRLEAVQLDEGRTFIHLRYSFSYSFLAYFVMKSYFSLFDSDRIGFSIIGEDREGNDVYVRGLRGKVERDVALYYLGIPAYMYTLNVPVRERFEKRISQWYDLTVQYKKQLSEMEKKEYLTDKRRDRESQRMLQGVRESAFQ
jgi:hypothetical protein